MNNNLDEILENYKMFTEVESFLSGRFKIVQGSYFYDERGWFREIATLKNVKQVNMSFSEKGVFRGFHYQKNNPQRKLVKVISGKILDIAICLDNLEVAFCEVSAEENNSIYLDNSIAHGFIALEPTVISYQCDELYDPDDYGVLTLKEVMKKVTLNDILIDYKIDWNSLLINKRDLG